MLYFAPDKTKKMRFLLPLAVVFFAFGVEISDYFRTCRFSKVLRVVRIFSMVTMHCAMLPILLFNYLHIQRRMGRNDGSFMAVYIANMLLAIIAMSTYEFYMFKQKALRQFLAHLFELAHASLLKRRLVAYVALMASSCLPFAITPYGIMSGENTLNTRGHGNGSNGTQPIPPYFMYHIYWHYVWMSTFRPFSLLNCAFFLYICFVMATSFRYLGARERFPSIRKFILRHQVLCSNMKTLEDLYSSLVFVMCTSDVFTTTFFLRSVSLSGNIATWKLSLLPYAILNFGLFVTRLMAASAVNTQVKKSLQGTDYLVNPLINGSEVDTSMTLIKLTCYIQRLSINPPSLTGGGFFTLKKGCILTVGNAILTYILVLYQSL